MILLAHEEAEVATERFDIRFDILYYIYKYYI